MPSVTIASNPLISGSTHVTYIGTPNVCSYWEVVGVVAEVEGAPVGSVIEKILLTDADGIAVNQYVASTTEGDAGKTERTKMSHPQ